MIYYKDEHGNLIKIPVQDGHRPEDLVVNQEKLAHAVTYLNNPKPATVILAVVN